MTYTLWWLFTWGPLIGGLVWWYVLAGRPNYRGE